MKPWSVRDLLRAVVLLPPLMGLCAWSGEALALDKFSRASAGWSTNSTWSTAGCGGAANTTAPGAADNVTICTGHTITTSANSSALSLDIQTGGTLTQATNRTLTIGSTLNVTGLFTCQNSLTVTGATTVSGTLTIANTAGTKTLTGDVTINGGTWNETVAEPISFGGSLTNNGTFTASTGVHTFTGAAKTFSGTNSIAIPAVAVTGSYTNNTTLTVATALSGAGSLTNGANQTLNLGGTTTVATLDASANLNTVNYNGAGAQTLKAATYHHLTLSGSNTKSTGAIILQVNGTTTVTGTATFNISSTTGTKTFAGPVVIDPNCSWTNTANEPVTFRGGITHDGTTFSSGTGTQTFDTNSQALAGSSAMTFGGAVTVSGAITLTNSNSNTVTITGTLNGSEAGSTFVNDTNATLNYGAAAAPMATGVLTASASPNTVNYNRAGTQTVRMPTGSAYHHLTLSGSLAKTMPAGAMTVGGDFTMSGTATATAAGAMTVNGNFTVGTGTTFGAATYAHGIKGNFSNSGTFTASTSTVTLDGAAAQTIGGTVATTFYRLTVNNAAGVSLSGVNATASNLLTLQSGVVTTGAQILAASANCPGGIARASGHVAGNLQLRFPTGAPSCTFHVGDGSDYRPIDATFASVTTSGSLTGTVSQSDGVPPGHPNITTSGLDSDKDVNRYWTLTNPTGGTIAFTTYTATFNFISGDIDGGADYNKFEIERWDGSAWSNTTPFGSAGPTSTSASGLPFFAAGASNDFAVGEKKPPFVNSIILASADPTAPATLVDWTVTFNSPVTGVDSTDFALVMGGGVSGATITGVAIVGGPTWSTTWTVTANTGAGAGTLGLKLVDDDTIINAAGKPLAGSFTGQVYTVVYTASGFVFTNSACVHNIAFGAPGQTCTQIDWPALQLKAGQAQTGIWITSINTSGVPTRLHASLLRTRDMAFRLICNDSNPIHERQADFAGATLPFCHSATWSSPATVVTFPGGSPSSNVDYTFIYLDVGSVELLMRNSAITTETGNSGTFVVKPWGFTVSVAANPAAADATGAAFVKAGASFTATVTAVANGGATTPNYGKESTPEGVLLTAALTPGLGLANLPALSNGSIPGSEFGSGGMFSDVNGVATVTNLAWAEVGIITLTPSVGDGDYLGVGDITGTVTGNIGRFYPDHFAIAPEASDSLIDRADINTGTTEACASTFTYLGEDFKTRFVLTAQNASNATTQNYAGGFAKLDLATWNNFVFTASGLPSGSTLGVGDTAPSGTWSSGQASVTASHKASRPASPVVPGTGVTVSALPVDSDGVTLPTAVQAHSGTTDLRFGILRFDNAYGSELLPIRVPVRVLYCNAVSGVNCTDWRTNAEDDCTPIAANTLQIGNVLKPGSSSLAFDPPPGGVAVTPVADGVGSLKITPAPKGVGSGDMAINLGATGADANCGTGIPAATAGAAAPWLRGKWCGANFDKDPTARIKFGSPKAPYIYLRERY